jgi:hypothetical protein
MKNSYSILSRLVVGYLTDELTAAELLSLEEWIRVSDDHLRMMADFTSVCWHAREALVFEEPDKMGSWLLIQGKVALLAGVAPLPDLRESEWVVGRRVSVLGIFRVLLR